jgi:hypothetical protein
MQLDPNRAVLFMKIGTHAQEDLSDIIARKQHEIDDAGIAMWGYGGNTCHPRNMVQPFARAAAAQGPIVLAMQPMNSKHFAEPLRAEEFSPDGITWSPVPAGINVLGSRYALCIRSLTQVDDTLDLGGMQVALGNSKGRVGSDYVRGRVDKACLEPAAGPSGRSLYVPIGLIAELVNPYAVFLKT